MYWLYILRNSTNNRYYIGSTSNLERRLMQHKKGYTRTTRLLKTDEVVYKEEYNSLEEARVREKKLKSYKSRKYLEWLIERSKSCPHSSVD